MSDHLTPPSDLSRYDRDLLVRIDTRMDNLERRMDRHSEDVREQLKAQGESFKEQLYKLEAVMVTKPRMRLVEVTLYGLVALILIFVINAILGGTFSNGVVVP